MFIKTPDGSLEDQNGKLVYISADRFIKDIVEGEACFICGAYPGAVVFNFEHVLPNWIIKRFDLQNAKINLPNDTGHKYATYKIPCCKSCNQLMSARFEKPISNLVKQGYNSVVDHVRHEGPSRLFIWLSLIFLKAHLKDKALPRQIDLPKGTEKISDAYAWETLHHIHCVARSFYSGAVLDPSAFGSLLIFEAKNSAPFTPFEYKDNYETQTVLLRMGNVGLLAVMNDSRGTEELNQRWVSLIDGPLSPGQLRELFSSFAYMNRILWPRPKFRIEPQYDKCVLIIRCNRPAMFVPRGFDLRTRTAGTLASIQDILETLGATVNSLNLQPNWTLLFNPDGTFDRHSKL